MLRAPLPHSPPSQIVARPRATTPDNTQQPRTHDNTLTLPLGQTRRPCSPCKICLPSRPRRRCGAIMSLILTARSTCFWLTTTAGSPRAPPPNPVTFLRTHAFSRAHTCASLLDACAPRCAALSRRRVVAIGSATFVTAPKLGRVLVLARSFCFLLRARCACSRCFLKGARPRAALDRETTPLHCAFGEANLEALRMC